jgi:hypothetical protein
MLFRALDFAIFLESSISQEASIFMPGAVLNTFASLIIPPVGYSNVLLRPK